MSEPATTFTCEPPADGVAFRVIRQEWNADHTLRTIHEVEILNGPNWQDGNTYMVVRSP